MANNCKYYKQQKQFSTNSGETWSNVIPYEYRRGSLIEPDSPDCQEEIKITRFVTIPDAFLCDGKDKYEKQVAQYSLDNGATWQYYYPSIFQLGNLVEANADICDNKWEGYYSGDTANICSNGYTYVAGRGCVKNSSSGGGGCPQGYSYNRITGGCVKTGGGATSGAYRHVGFDPVKYVRCSSTTSTTLTRDDVNYSPYTLYEGYIGDCVASIGASAFISCSGLTSVTIPNSVTTIGNSAFENCSGITSIDIPNSVTTISGSAFQNCRSLTSITIPDSVTSIGASAFYQCSGLTEVTIGNSVTSIGNNAFSGCTSLTSILIPNSVTTIGIQAFASCGGLTTVRIGSGVTSIGTDAFYYCSSLTSVICLAETPPTLGFGAFTGSSCPIYVPSGSLEAYQSAWSTYASRIQSIPPYALYRWYPSGTTCIGYDKYQNNIKQQSTDSGATWENVSPPEYSASTVIEYNSEDCGYVPPPFKWLATYTGGTTSSAECDASSAITSGEVTSKTAITSFEIGQCVTSISGSAFSGCTSLSSLSIGSGVTSIGNSAFKGCSDLTEVTIPSSVTSIGSWAFQYCTSLTSITIPDSVTEINSQTFQSCTSLTSVTIGNSVTFIGAYAFAECSGLTNINIPDSVTTIATSAFQSCTSLTSIDIPSGTTSITAYVFDGCSGLTSMTIPNSVTEIFNGAFRDCSSLTSITCLATTPPSLGSSVFNGSTCPIYVPSESVEAYKSAYRWSSYASRIQPIPTP